MQNPTPLPDDLGDRPFNRSTAASLGVSRGRLRASDITHPFRGVLTIAPPRTLPAVVDAYAVRLQPGEFFSHVTAAAMHGLPLPFGLDPLATIDVSAVHPAGAPVARGVRGHRLRVQPQLDLRCAVPMVTATEAWCELGVTLSMTDLIVVADVLLNRALDEASGMTDLAERASAYHRPAERKLLRSLDAARRGSASPGETRTRLVFLFAGLPEPELNGVVDGRRGEVLGHGDFVWRARRVVAEYEGDGHRTSVEQFRYDIERYERFRDAGWTVVRITADHLRPAGSQRLVARIRDLVVGDPAWSA